MPIVTVLPANKTVEAQTGTSLREAIIASGVKFVTKCGGEAQCGLCHVFVPEGKKSLSKAERLENDKLDTIVGVGSKSRLACQAKLGTENVSVEILSFI